MVLNLNRDNNLLHWIVFWIIFYNVVFGVFIGLIFLGGFCFWFNVVLLAIVMFLWFVIFYYSYKRVRDINRFEINMHMQFAQWELTEFLNQLKYEGNLFANRVNLFLLAESLIFLSFFTYTSEIETYNDPFVYVIIIFAIIVTLYYLYVMMKNYIDIGKLDSFIRTNVDIYRLVSNTRIGLSVNFIFSFCLISLFFLF